MLLGELGVKREIYHWASEWWSGGIPCWVHLYVFEVLVASTIKNR